MTASPKISIVTPSFNQGTYIEEALLSVKRQEYENIEHLVIDGGSTDGTLEILRDHEARPGWQHLRWISERDNGQSDALNRGFRLAKGNLIGWLNSDDRYREGAFDAITHAAAAFTSADILYGDYTFMDSDGRVDRIRREIEFSRFILHYHRVLYIPTTATFFRRRIFDEGNLLDERLHYAMDYDFFLRLAKRGYRFKHVPAVLADFRVHAESKSGAFCRQQLREHDIIARQHSPLLQRLKHHSTRSAAFGVLRSTAAALRYSEKLLRGYYFRERKAS